MSDAVADTPMSPEAYLAFEDTLRREDGKHEYADGRIVPMIGASFAHDTITMNTKILLATALKSTPWRVNSGDIRVHIEAAHAYFYPDCSVSPVGASATADTTTDARVVVEVLSPSTRYRDRTEKLETYKKLPSLQDILLIEQSARRVEQHSRTEHGWTTTIIIEDGHVMLPSLGLTLPMADIYDGLDDLT